MRISTFKYIDKDRMVPALLKRRDVLITLAYSEEYVDQRMAILGVIDEIDRILQKVDEGLWDWQPSQ